MILRALRVGAVMCLAAMTLGSSQPTVLQASLRPRTALPASRLEFGLSNLDSTWMTASGVPWRYRFQYLSAGVNTGKGWETWQDPALPPGQFALDYMRSSTTAPANYIPVFTYYELLQSLPSIGGSELQRDFNNLNNVATMNAYYSNFKLLMQRAGAYGGQVVNHMEPDFWGYMQQQAAGGSATAITAMVKSSGFPEAGAFPDNLVGFASELKYLRDTYAPNALLAMHASMWSSSIDIASTTDPTVDGTAEADKTAAFLNSAGAGGWDAVFNDVDDHNAAWWELASCGTPPCVNQYFTHWWDSNNIKFPNFNRYLAWVGELHNKTALPQVVWQVPMGNQYFLTMNNTCGHYQDNVAPYFLSHAGQLFSSGLVAVLFGPGNSCQTSFDDAQKDGVTNNSGSPTTDQLGGCSACNTRTSSWADDDGGYLRIFVGKYYAGQMPCGSVAATAAPGSPQLPGTQVQITGAASGCANPQYEFWELPPGSSTWQLARAYSSTATLTWDTTGKNGGTYTFSVWARDASSAGRYGNSLGTWDAYTPIGYSLTSKPCTSVTVSSSPPGIAPGSTAVTIAVSAAGCPNARYQLWRLAPGSSTWQLAQAYSSNATLNWNTTGFAAGIYHFSLWARDANSAGIGRNGLGSWDAYTALQYDLTSTPCTSHTVTTSPPGSATIGTVVLISGSAGGCPNPSSEFWILYPGSSTWTLLKAYSTSSTYNWITSGKPAGTYRFSVWARDATSAGTYGSALGRWDAYCAFSYVLT